MQQLVLPEPIAPKIAMPVKSQEVQGNTGIGEGLLSVGNGLRSNVLSNGKDTEFYGPAERVNGIH